MKTPASVYTEPQSITADAKPKLLVPAHYKIRALKPTPTEAKPLPKLEQQIVCPYNANHVVSALQIHYHLAQCRDVFYDEFRSSMQLVSCKYDGRHLVPAPEIELHEVFCHGRGTYRKVTNAISKPPVNVYSPHTATG